MLLYKSIHPHAATARLPRSAGNRGSKTVTGFAVERLGEFWIQLVIWTPGTEYYLMKDKADRETRNFSTDQIFQLA